jgi:alcohol dehydrogenase
LITAPTPVSNTAQVRAGTTVAVVGLGGVGLASVLGAVASGARQVVAVDLSDEKLALARELGATHTVNAADPEVVDKVKKMTNGGVDYAIEMAGATRAFETAYRITRRGGTTVTAGLPHPNATWAMPATHLVAEERTIKGSYIGTCVPSRDLPRYIELYRAGKLPVNKLMSGKMKLEEINEGFDLLHEGKAVRQVVTF